ncbi:DUF6230 family protein [Streptomyces cellulosae]|uniref:DUF6230 family protein n=1 Tax=Streptomyces cellulosae TaxID=1968 RepID=UPI0004C57C7C|nr:DUF6230 family protein [Streptomyces cellulosae]
MESQVRGGTRWKRFAVVMVPSVAATACIGVALAQGALAASFSVSGQEFKVSAGKLVGHGMTQYGALDSGTSLSGEKQKHPVAVSAFNTAEITKLCQSVVTPIPGFGNVTLKLTAGDKGKDVRAEQLYIDTSVLDSSNAVFEDIDIGVPVGSANRGPKPKPEEGGSPFAFAQQAKTATLTDVHQTSWATTAATFTLTNLHMDLSLGKGEGIECY